MIRLRRRRDTALLAAEEAARAHAALVEVRALGHLHSALVDLRSKAQLHLDHGTHETRRGLESAFDAAEFFVERLAVAEVAPAVLPAVYSCMRASGPVETAASEDLRRELAAEIDLDVTAARRAMSERAAELDGYLRAL